MGVVAYGGTCSKCRRAGPRRVAPIEDIYCMACTNKLEEERKKIVGIILPTMFMTLVCGTNQFKKLKIYKIRFS